MEKLVSIIVPVYNVEKYLDACIRSLIEQTYKNIEIILVDDGSTDRSGEICDLYANQYSLIKTIHQGNEGLSGARNTGLAASKGEYISLIDSDDFVEKNFIRVLYDAIENNDCDISCMETYPFLDGNDQKVYDYWNSFDVDQITSTVYKREDIYDLALYQILKVTGAQQKLYKREIFSSVQFLEGKYYEDIGSLPDILFRIHKFAMVDKSLYAYRLRQNSIMSESFNQHKMDCIWVSDHIVEVTKQNMPEERHINAAYCAAFRVNRVTYAQIPSKGYERERKQIWQQICKFRKTVLMDSKAPKYDRILCASGYLGEGTFRVCVDIFTKIKAKFY